MGETIVLYTVLDIKNLTNKNQGADTPKRQREQGADATAL